MTSVHSNKHGGGAPCGFGRDVGSRFRTVIGADSGRFSPAERLERAREHFAHKVDCNKHGGGSPCGLLELKISGLDFEDGFRFRLDVNSGLKSGCFLTAPTRWQRGGPSTPL